MFDQEITVSEEAIPFEQFAKNVVEAEAREQARDASRSRSKTKKRKRR